jgi:predicted metal-dependent enzyme (double-stranded beta helix superfamily)
MAASDDGTTALEHLIADIRQVVGRGESAATTAGSVEQVLARYLPVPGLLPDAARVSDPDHYRQNIVHVEPGGGFSVVALVWLPGQCTPVHDHVSWCVVGVYEGDEAEVRYRVEDSTGHVVDDLGVAPDENGVVRSPDHHLARTEESTNPHGSVCGFAPPGDLHQVWNAGEDTAISIHVYGADIGVLGSSVRRSYELPVW